MSNSRSSGRRPTSRTKFRPTIDCQLEDRKVLNATSSIATVRYLLNNTHPRGAKVTGSPKFVSSDANQFTQNFSRRTQPTVQVARGGQAAIVQTKDGTRFKLQLSYTSNTLQVATNGSDNNQAVAPTTGATGNVSLAAVQSTTNYPQPAGTIRVYPMAGGKVGIIVDASTTNTELTISQLPTAQNKGQAHSFAYGEAYRGHMLNIGQLTVNSGSIGAILGYHTSILSGPLVVSGITPIDRIAFAKIEQGGSIQTGGDVNTLDIYGDVNLNSPEGISIGRDLNLLNVNGDITLSNGSSFFVGRDMGLVLQPPKGTGTGSNVLSLNNANSSNTNELYPNVSAYILGNINIDTASGSSFVISRYNDQQFTVGGSLIGASGFFAKGGPTGTGTFRFTGSYIL